MAVFEQSYLVLQKFWTMKIRLFLNKIIFDVIIFCIIRLSEIFKNFDTKIANFSFEMLDFQMKMAHFDFKMKEFWSKITDFELKLNVQ